jgi:hypothetical protein
MASDLSKLIQDSFTLTLNGLLAKDAKIIKITKAHPYDIEDTELLLVQSSFNFSTFTTKFSYLIPAKSASLIFNTMMGSPITELSDEIDDDAEDAIGEFISNTSGGLTTAINAAEFEDVGQTKFNISHKEILNGNDIQDLETTFRFLIDLEDQDLVLYVTFEEVILPYISDIMASEMTFHQERSQKVEEEEIIKEIEEQQEKQDQLEEQEKIAEEEPIIKIKYNKSKLAILILGGVSALTSLIVIILYFAGVFDPEPVAVKKVDLNTTKKVQRVSVIEYKQVKKIDFKVSDIDKNRLNNKLQDLTKYTVLTKEELEQQKEEEILRLLALEKEKQLLEFAKRNEEEPLPEKESPEPEVKEETGSNQKENSEVVTKKEEPKQEIVAEPEITKEPKLNYVFTSSLKYRLFKSVVQETTTTKARISICNNQDGKTTIFIGPFESESLQNKMIELTKQESPDIDINAINITEEEFSSRCNLE